MKYRAIGLTLVWIHLATASANAGSVLLASFDRVNGSGATGLTVPRVQIGFRVGSIEDSADSISLDMILFSSEFIDDGGGGVFDFDVASNPLALAFATLLTNGIDDRLGLFTVWAGGLHVGIRSDSESFYFGRNLSNGDQPDLVNYQLDFIRLIVRDVQIEPITFQEMEGLSATIDYTYEFYGSPVPEPATVAFLLGGSIGMAWRSKR